MITVHQEFLRETRSQHYPSVIKLSFFLSLFCLINHDLFAQEGLESEEIVDTSHWVCRFCDYPSGWFGRVDLGGGNVSDASNAFGDYRGLEDDGLFVSLDGQLHFRNESEFYLDLDAKNVGLDSRSFKMEGGKQGKYKLRLSYRETPKYRGFGTQTPFINQGDGALTLPSDWVRSENTSGFVGLDGALKNTDLLTQRKTLDAGFTLRMNRKWTYRIDFEHQQKKGSRPYGGGFFLGNTSHIPAPVDYSTQRIDSALEYTGLRSHLNLGFSGSDFDNNQSTLSWQNPFQSPPGTEVFRADLAPDNQFYQFHLGGSMALSSGIRLSGKAVLGRMKQDDPLLPYSINPNFDDLVLPRSSLQGKTDVSSLNLSGKLSAKLARRLDFSTRIKVDERDNKTEVELWTPVLTDLVLQQPRPNRPYSFKREKLDFDLRWRSRKGIRLMGGFRREEIERSLQSVDKTLEQTWWGEISFQPWAMAHFRFKLETSERDASPYILLDDGGPIENPLMRKFHLADRQRDKIVLEADFAPLDSLGINVSYFIADDDYSESQLGLMQNEETSLSVNLNYAMKSNVTVYGFVNLDEYDARISSMSASGFTPWNSTTNDKIETYGLGVSGELNHRLSFGLDWFESKSKGKILTETGLGESPFPALSSELKNLSLHFSLCLLLSCAPDRPISRSCEVPDNTIGPTRFN